MSITCECGKVNEVPEGLEEIDSECIEGYYLFSDIEDGYTEECPCLCHPREMRIVEK